MKGSYTPNDEHRELVSGMVLAGVPIATIATILKVSNKTLYKYYRAEIEDLQSQKRARLAAKAWSMATEGDNHGMTIFMCKTQLGWREKEHVIHEGELRTSVNLISDGQPLRGAVAAERGKPTNKS